jgi:hypothetical protein
MSGIHLTMRLAPWTDLSNYADRIDTHDVIERIEELEAEYSDTETGEVLPVGGWDSEAWQEWQTLTALIVECDKVAQYEGHTADGMSLTRESYMTEYAAEWYSETYSPFEEYDGRQFKNVRVSWDDLTSRLPFSCIDWGKVAEVMESDSDSVTYDGVTYYVC